MSGHAAPRPARNRSGRAERSGGAREAVRGTAAVIRDVVAQTVIVLLLSLIWWADAPMLVGWQPRVVLTGSMRPALRPGDVILIAPVANPAELPAGRVVVVRRPDLPGGSYTHRVVRHRPNGELITRGDANATEDQVAARPDQVMGEVRLVVPMIGTLPLWIRSGRLVPAAALIIALWTALTIAWSARAAGRR